ncbi:hypothetical protein MLD38_018019 [Melastoma candidum]|uniref:Uncharacterized protein n=1 Tax=Melastoma candidum TaxID=119954 RepID=A0ACB9QSJ4_9MYRT|nr:hypothetical protein MLD38_018019 [Melastoma candidum]
MQSPLHPVAVGETSSRRKMRVSINLPEDETSMANSVLSSPITLINDRISWALDYGNAILSKWKIKGWTIPITQFQDGWASLKYKNSVLVYCYWVCCTSGLLKLDHNSLDDSSYSISRWMDIVKVYKLGLSMIL